MAKILTISIQKGGSGKTTTAVNLAAELAAAGKHVLLVDCDPQGTLTGYTGVATEQGKTLAAVMDGKQSIDQIIISVWEGVDLVPGTIDLSVSELTIAAKIGRENILKRALEPVKSRYDYILIDTPPSLGLLTVNALSAADGVLITTQPTAADLWGLKLFLQTLDDIKAINPNLFLFGVLLTFYDQRLTLHQTAAEQLKDAGIKLLPIKIGRSVRIAEAAGEHKPLREYDQRNAQNENYQELAKEVIEWQN